MGQENIKAIDVSIIIVNYNSFSILEKCLNSLFKFTSGLNFEVIIVDNNSTEGKVEDFISQYQDIILIKNDSNIGFASANNVGIKYAKGKYILFLNNDVVFHENSIKQVFDFAEAFKSNLFIGCKLLNADGTHQISVVDFDNIFNSFGENFFLYKLFPTSSFFNRYHLNYKKVDQPIEVDIIKGAFMFCSTDAIKKLSGFDTRFFFYGEEADLCYRFKMLNGRIYYFPYTSVNHIGGATVDSYPWFKFKNQSIAKIKKYQKHLNNPQFRIIMIFYFTGLLIRVPVYFLMGILSFNKSLLLQSYYYLRLLFTYPKNEFKSS
jgi:GT2 family glycosyltransferase